MNRRVPSSKGAVRAIVLVSAFLFCGDSHAQEDLGSAIISGVGGAYSAVPDAPGVLWSNPAIVAFGGGRAAASLSYRRLFELAELDEVLGTAVVPVGSRYTLGVGVTYFGDAALYGEFTGLVTGAVRLTETWALGTGLRYRRTEFGGGTVAYASASLDLGAAWRPRHDLLAAVALREIRIDRLYEDGNPPTAIDASLAWSLPPDLTIAGRWYKERDRTARFGVGQVLRLAESVSFVSGLRFDPIRYALGARLTHQSLILDYVYQSHPDLGGTHSIGIGGRW